jgi:hypothetical protein
VVPLPPDAIGGLCAFENVASVDASLAIRIRQAGSVGCQAAGFGELAPFVDRRKRMTCAKRYDLIALAVEERTGANEERADAL